VIVTDLLAPALSADALRRLAAELAPVSDACLLGDHQQSRVQFPPSYRVRLLADEGVPAWAGLNTRDRNRVALEGEVAACLDAGAVGLHCVTGDHPAAGHRPDARAVFDLDAVGVVGLAAGRGALCSVAHAPTVPPVERRLPRLLAKIRAGADAVFVDGPGDPEVVGPAVAALRATGFTGLVLACVTPYPATTSDAVRRVERVLALSGVDGVNLSGGAGPGDEMTAARRLAEVAAAPFGRGVKA
jgi:5,10-methylenetetrahydrofolate reductase